MFDLDELVGEDEVIEEEKLTDDYMLIIHNGRKALVKVSDVSINISPTNYKQFDVSQKPEIHFVLYLSINDPLLYLTNDDLIDIQYKEYYCYGCWITTLEQELSSNLKYTITAIANRVVLTN